MCRLPKCFKLAADTPQPNKSAVSTAAELNQRRKTCFRISTGSEAWDKILKGGFESCSVSEVYGEFRCGKTQLSHTMCVVAQLSTEARGANGKVAIIGKSPNSTTIACTDSCHRHRGYFSP